MRDSALVVDFAAMANPGYFDSTLQIIDDIDDPIVSYADAPLRLAALELLAAHRARVVSQGVNALHDPVGQGIGKLIELFEC